MNDQRFRVNAEQVASGAWKMSITVELKDPLYTMTDKNGQVHERTHGEMWEVLEADLRNHIHKIGGVVVDELKKKDPGKNPLPTLAARRGAPE